MLRRVLLLSVLVLAAAGTARSQALSARRMAMGGVILAGGGPGTDAANVAYRAVPPAPNSAWGVSLPIGLIPVLADPPELDPDSPDFNVYELANLLYNPPWNLQLVAPEPPSNDISIAIGKDHLAVDLGEVTTVFPEDHGRAGAVVNGPAFGFGFRGAFVAAAPLVYYENDLSFNDALRRAIDGEEFQPDTDYRMLDDGRGMAAVGLHLGWAGPLARAGDPRGAGAALYVGARVKLMRGLVYGQAGNSVSFTTEDTLFAQDPVDVHYVGRYYDAGPEGGRLGRGLDLGAVWMGAGLEVGLGVNDIGTTFDWRVRESIAHEDPATGDYVQEVIARDKAVTTTVPATVTANAALQLKSVLLAATAVRGVNATTTAHLGAETWLGRVAVRVGLSLDDARRIQCAGGAGLRFGPMGVDLALATNSRNLSRERGLELGAGLAFYR